VEKQQEKFEVFNNGSTAISFEIRLPVPENLDGLAKHHRSRILRQHILPICIPIHQSLDLVTKTGLTVEQLRKIPEIKQVLSRNGHAKLTEEIRTEETRLEAKKELEVEKVSEAEEVVAPPPPVIPSVEAESTPVEEKKPVKRGRKKKKATSKVIA